MHIRSEILPCSNLGDVIIHVTAERITNILDSHDVGCNGIQGIQGDRLKHHMIRECLYDSNVTAHKS
jgi:hypothetical protein